jgi:hypothetical protein
VPLDFESFRQLFERRVDLPRSDLGTGSIVGGPDFHLAIGAEDAGLYPYVKWLDVKRICTAWACHRDKGAIEESLHWSGFCRNDPGDVSWVVQSVRVLGAST